MLEENPSNVDREDRESNTRWKERRARLEEQQRLANEELAREKKENRHRCHPLLSRLTAYPERAGFNPAKLTKR
jgi:hypothetical protein